MKVFGLGLHPQFPSKLLCCNQCARIYQNFSPDIATSRPLSFSPPPPPVPAKKEILKSEMKKKLLEKYGGAEHLEPAPRELVFGPGDG